MMLSVLQKIPSFMVLLTYLLFYNLPANMEIVGDTSDFCISALVWVTHSKFLTVGFDLVQSQLLMAVGM